MKSHRTVWALLALWLLLPAALLWPSTLGDRTYLPFDPATMEPASWQYTDAELAAAADGANRDVTEVSAWFVPELRQARAALAQGQWPGWAPWAHGGSVLQGHGHVALLDPPTWIALAHDDPERGLVWIAWLHFALAGFFGWGFLRCLGLHPWAALLGAATFALSATVCANGPFYPRLGSLVWLPGLLWAARALADRAADGRRLAPAAVGLAAAMACTWLAGFPPYSAAVTFTVAAYCLSLVWERARAPARAPASSPAAASAIVLAAALLAAAACGLLLAAPHLLPVLEFFPESNRAVAPELTQVSHNVFPIGGILGYLLPDVFGHMADPLPYDRSPLAYLLLPRTEWGTGRPLLPAFSATEYAVFAGTAALVLAPLGLLAGGRRRGGFAGGAWLLLLALAGGWPIVRLVYHLPLVPTVAPQRFLGPAAWCLAWLSAVGLDRILRGEVSRRALHWTGVATAIVAVVAGSLALLWSPATLPEDQQWTETIAAAYQDATTLDLNPENVRALFRESGTDWMVRGAQRLVTGLGAAAVALLLMAAWCLAQGRWSGPRVRQVAAALLVVATVAQLAIYGGRANRGIHALPSARTPVHDALAAARQARADQGGLGVLRAANRATVPLLVPPGSLTEDRVRDFQVYTFIDGRSNRPFVELQAGHIVRAQGGTWEQATAAQRDAARTQAQATIYGGAVPATLPDAAGILDAPYLDLIGVHTILARQPLRHAGPSTAVRVGTRDVYLHTNPDALPRAFVVPDLRTAADDDAVLQRLVAPDFEPAAAAFVTDEVARSLPRPPAVAPAAPRRSVRFLRDEPTVATLDIAEGAAGYLVVSDTFLPGWRATIDGADAPLVRANLWMRVVPIPAGRCTVEMVYTTPGLATGTICAALAVLCLGAWWIWGASRRSPPRSDRTM